MPSFRQQFSYKINKAELDMAAIGRYDLSEPSRKASHRQVLLSQFLYN